MGARNTGVEARRPTQVQEKMLDYRAPQSGQSRDLVSKRSELIAGDPLKAIQPVGRPCAPPFFGCECIVLLDRVPTHGRAARAKEDGGTAHREIASRRHVIAVEVEV